MLQSPPRYTTTWINSINQVAPDLWNALAKVLKTPFLEWEWLHNLEASGCATPKEGWLPNHLLVWQGETLIAAAPLYVKGHSYGEFVFDHQWADLSYRLGIEYYPKLLGMAPFTPAAGYRFLIQPDLPNADQVIDLILAEIDRFCDRNHFAGCHFLFVDPEWKVELASRGYTIVILNRR